MDAHSRWLESRIDALERANKQKEKGGCGSGIITVLLIWIAMWAAAVHARDYLDLKDRVAALEKQQEVRQ